MYYNNERVNNWICMRKGSKNKANNEPKISRNECELVRLRQ